jgi:hypothetical protein
VTLVFPWVEPDNGEISVKTGSIVVDETESVFANPIFSKWTIGV